MKVVNQNYLGINHILTVLLLPIYFFSRLACYPSQNQNFFVSPLATKPYLYGTLLKITHVLFQAEVCLKTLSNVEFYVNSLLIFICK